FACVVSVVTYQDAGAVEFIKGFKPACKVHGIAYHSIIQTLHRTHVSDDKVSCIDPHPCSENRPAFMFAALCKFQQRVTAIKSGPACTQGMVRKRGWSDPESHYGIAYVFVDGSMASHDLSGHL